MIDDVAALGRDIRAEVAKAITGQDGVVDLLLVALFSSGTAGRLFAAIVVSTVPLAIALPWYSQRLLARGVSSRVGRGLVSAAVLIAGGLMFTTLLLGAMPATLRVMALAMATGLVPVIYTLGPAMLAQVVPEAQRGSILAIDNSIASIAGVIAPVVTGLLIEQATGARGFELGFGLCGVLMVAGGVAGAMLASPESSSRKLGALNGVLLTRS